MNISMTDSGLDFLCRQEEFRARPYLDSAGKPTIGYGHLIQRGETFSALTEAEALALLKADLVSIARPVAVALKWNIRPYQADAILSLAFNVGGPAIARSTLLRLVNSGSIGAAADQFRRWNKITVNGRKVVSKGLTARRERERKLFLFADYGDSGQ